MLPKDCTCTDLPLFELFVISYKLKKQELKLLMQQASTFSFNSYSPGKKFDNPFLHTKYPVIKDTGGS